MHKKSVISLIFKFLALLAFCQSKPLQISRVTITPGGSHNNTLNANFSVIHQLDTNQKSYKTPIKVESPQGLIKASIYPNPGSDVINLMINKVNGMSYEIFSSDGKQITSKTPLKENQTSINISSYSKGLYFIKISGSGVPNNKTIRFSKI